MNFIPHDPFICRDGREVDSYKVRGAFIIGKVGNERVVWSSTTGHEAFNGNSMLERDRDLVNGLSKDVVSMQSRLVMLWVCKHLQNVALAH